MPKKITEDLTAEESAIVKEVVGKCGHVNRHSRDHNGKLDNLACTKDKGHGGEHGAEHQQWTPDPDGTQVINKMKMAVKPVWVEWGNMAGIPVEKITPVPTAKKQEGGITNLDDVRSLVGGDIPRGTQIDIG